MVKQRFLAVFQPNARLKDKALHSHDIHLPTLNYPRLSVKAIVCLSTDNQKQLMPNTTNTRWLPEQGTTRVFAKKIKQTNNYTAKFTKPLFKPLFSSRTVCVTQYFHWNLLFTHVIFHSYNCVNTSESYNRHVQHVQFRWKPLHSKKRRRR